MELLSVENVVKRYANHTALNDVSISLQKQSIFGLLGPNGAGKTSLIRIINQITAPDAGRVFFKGEPLAPKHIPLIGYLPEERGLYKKMKVGDQLTYLCRLRGLSRQEVKHRLKYWFEKFEITSWWDKSIEDLSKGMQQKIQFIATVLHEPELLILDEPFTGFDPVNAALIRDEILELRKKGCTVIFSTHRMETVEELCDHIALINLSRKVLDGAKKDIKAQFKTNTFVVEAEQAIPENAALYEIIKQETVNDQHQQAYIKLLTNRKSDVIQFLAQQVEIVSFHENLPTMADIFVKAVEEQKSI